MKKKPSLFVICEDDKYPGVEGVFHWCDKCKRKVYLSDSTVRNAAKNGYKKKELSPLCLPCAVPVMAKVKGFIDPSEEQLNEVYLALWGKHQEKKAKH